MKRTRIFMAFLMIVALLAFTGCANDDNGGNPVAPNGTGNGIVDNGANDNNGVNDRNGMNDNGLNDNLNDQNGTNGSNTVTGGGVNNNNAM